jgi:uncharacterized protein YpmS
MRIYKRLFVILVAYIMIIFPFFINTIYAQDPETKLQSSEI